MPDLEAIIGQEQLKDKIKAVAAGGNPSHAYLFEGEKRSGKSTLALCFAKALLCEGEGRKPCNNCLSCMQVDAGAHPDLVVLQHEKPETIGIDDIREGLNDDIQLKPYRSKYKIYIVDDAQKMTVKAQNALLKTLEEPPSYGIIILTANSADSLLPTILSRVVVLPIKPLTDERIKKYLMEYKHIPDYRADVIVAFARGNLGKAVDLIGNESFEKNKTDAIGILKGLGDADYGKCYQDAVTFAKAYKDDRAYINEMLDFFLLWYRDALVYKASKRTEGLIFREEIQYIKKVSGDISYEGFEEIFKAIKDAKEKLKFNVNTETVADLLFLSLKDCRKEK